MIIINEAVDKSALKRKVIDNKFNKLIETGTEDEIKNFISKYYNDIVALTKAAENGYLPLVKYYISKGQNPSANDNLAIRWASHNGHTEVVELLKKHGCTLPE